MIPYVWTSGDHPPLNPPRSFKWRPDSENRSEPATRFSGSSAGNQRPLALKNFISSAPATRLRSPTSSRTRGLAETSRKRNSACQRREEREGSVRHPGPHHLQSDHDSQVGEGAGDDEFLDALRVGDGA